MTATQSNNDKLEDSDSEQEARLRSALERETNFERRQQLLKALWRLGEPIPERNGDASSKAGSDQHGSAKRSRPLRRQLAKAMCC